MLDGSNTSWRSNTSFLLTRDAGGHDFEALIELYVIGVLIVFGMIANVVSIVVLKRYRERRDSLFLLQALAVVDCLYLAAAALRYPLKYLLKPSADADPYTDMQPTVFPLLKTFQVQIIFFFLYPIFSFARNITNRAVERLIFTGRQHSSAMQALY